MSTQEDIFINIFLNFINSNYIQRTLVIIYYVSYFFNARTSSVPEVAEPINE